MFTLNEHRYKHLNKQNKYNNDVMGRRLLSENSERRRLVTLVVVTRESRRSPGFLLTV